MREREGEGERIDRLSFTSGKVKRDKVCRNNNAKCEIASADRGENKAKMKEERVNAYHAKVGILEK